MADPGIGAALRLGARSVGPASPLSGQHLQPGHNLSHPLPWGMELSLFMSLAFLLSLVALWLSLVKSPLSGLSLVIYFVWLLLSFILFPVLFWEEVHDISYSATVLQPLPLYL